VNDYDSCSITGLTVSTQTDGLRKRKQKVVKK